MPPRRSEELPRGAQSGGDKQALLRTPRLAAMPLPPSEQLQREWLTVIVLGASGGLALNKVFPALRGLEQGRFLPRHTRILAAARTHNTTEGFRRILLARESQGPAPSASASALDGVGCAPSLLACLLQTSSFPPSPLCVASHTYTTRIYPPCPPENQDPRRAVRPAGVVPEAAPSLPVTLPFLRGPSRLVPARLPPAHNLPPARERRGPASPRVLSPPTKPFHSLHTCPVINQTFPSLRCTSI